jgi:predicted transcriptional regulator
MAESDDPRREFDDVVLRAVLFAGRPVTSAEIAERVGATIERVESALQRLARAHRVVARGDLWTSR